MNEEELRAIVESCDAKLTIRENISTKGNGSSSIYVYARRGKIQRSLGELNAVLAMSKEELREIIVSKFKEEVRR